MVLTLLLTGRPAASPLRAEPLSVGIRDPPGQKRLTPHGGELWLRSACRRARQHQISTHPPPTTQHEPYPSPHPAPGGSRAVATPLQPLPPSPHGLPPASASLSLTRVLIRVPLRTIRMFSSLHPSLRLQGPLFQIRSQPQVLGVKTQTPPPGSPFSPLPGPRCVETADLWAEELPVNSHRCLATRDRLLPL